MPMAPLTSGSSCGPNLTGNKLRRTCGDCCLRRYRVDPTWGIPPGTPPLSVDPVNGMVRPFSSFTTLANAMDNFIGFSSEWFPPGEDHLVWVYLCGWIEMQLSPAGTVTVGDKYIPVDSGAISDYLAAKETIMVPGIWTAVESCWCENDWVKRATCLSETHPYVAVAPNDTSPIGSTPTYYTSDMITQRTVTLQFGDCCNLADYTEYEP